MIADPGRGLSVRAMTVTVDELVLADAPELWSQLGFRVEGELCRIGTVRVRLAGSKAGKRVAAWSLRGIETTELDGLATTISTEPEREPAEPHPNGVSA